MTVPAHATFAIPFSRMLRDAQDDIVSSKRVLEGTKRQGRLRPDFTFIDAAGDELVWEHLGMLSKESYRRSWDWKLQWYADNGLEEGKNLFTTRDGADGSLSQADVTAVAQAIDAEL